MARQSKDDIKDWTEEHKYEYCKWCFFKDYGDCNKCALHMEWLEKQIKKG